MPSVSCRTFAARAAPPEFDLGTHHEIVICTEMYVWDGRSCLFHSLDAAKRQSGRLARAGRPCVKRGELHPHSEQLEIPLSDDSKNDHPKRRWAQPHPGLCGRVHCENLGARQDPVLDCQ